jgi:solute carrier family 25 protein 39/40
MQIPTNCLYFAGYERMKRVLHSKHLTGYYVPLIAGVTARTFAVLFTCPLELIRTATQASVEIKPTKVLTNAIKNGGFRSLWTGLWPTLMRDCPFSAIYWVSLESTRKYLQSSSHIPSYMINFISGATGGAIAATLTTPIDVIKTRMQARIGNTQFDSPYNSTLQSIRRIMKQDGLLGFTKGMVPRVLKVVPR